MDGRSLVSSHTTKRLLISLKIFDSPNFIRIVTSVPVEKMEEAVERIAQFACAHALVRGTA